MPKSIYHKLGPWILLAVAASVPFVVVSAHRAFLSNHNQVDEWLPQDMEETQRFRRFAERFGSDEILLISWPGCTLNVRGSGDEQAALLERLSAALRQPPTLDNRSLQPLFRKVYTGPSMFAKLTAAPLKLSRTEALERLSGWLVGPDGKSTGALALVSPAGQADRAAAIEWTYRCAERECGIARNDLRLAGSTVDGVAIDQASTESIDRLNPIAWGLGLLIAWLALGRSFRLAILVFGTAQFCSAFTMAVIYWTGAQVDAVLLMVSTLAFVLTCSGTVHLINYFYDAQHLADEVPTIDRAVRTAWPPSALAALTTILGVGSLMVSGILPIKRFGGYAALAVLFGLIIVFVVLPACLALWPGRRLPSRSLKKGVASRRFWRWLANLVIARHRTIGIAGGLLAVVSVWGAGRIQTSVNLHSLLSPHTKVLRDYRWVQEHIGPMVPMEVVVRFAGNSPRAMAERLAVVEEIAEELRNQQHVGATITAATFLPDRPQGGGVSNVIARVFYKRELAKNRDAVIESRYLQEDGENELWRISVRVAADESLDYGVFLSDLERELKPQLESLQANFPAGLETEFCGGIPLINQAQRELLNDLYSSFGVAVLLVMIVMILLLRSVVAGLLSMIPNLLPVLVVFGAMGVMGVAIEIGSMMTASVALGIAVDDTLHFIFWFRRQTALGRSRKAAVRSAYRNCGAAMCQTTLICGLVFLVFAASTFVPTAHFAWLISTMLFSALATDLLLLPAILVSPLGRLFEATAGKKVAKRQNSLSVLFRW